MKRSTRTSCAVVLCSGILTFWIPFAQAQLKGSSEFSFTNNDGSIAITGYSGTSGEVVIPSSINNLPVTRIGDAAFSSCSALTGLTIPNTITNIGKQAFYGTDLKCISIPDSVTEIGDAAFFACERLTTVKIGKGTRKIGSIAFDRCQNLDSVYFGGDAPIFGDFVFRGSDPTLYYLPKTSGWDQIGYKMTLLIEDSLVGSYVRNLQEAEKSISAMDGQMLNDDARNELAAIKAVLACVGQNDTNNQVSELLGLLRSENANTRKHACTLLGLWGGESAAGPLLDTFENDETCRSEAGKALGKLGQSGANALVHALKTDNKDVVVAAADCLGSMEPTNRRLDNIIVNSLTKVLLRPNEEECDAAVEALGAYTNAQSITAIIRSLQETNIYTSNVSSSLALVRVGKPCVPQLLEALNKCHAADDAEFAGWSVAVLADLTAVEAIPTLQKIAGSSWALPSDQDNIRPQNPLQSAYMKKDVLNSWGWANNSACGLLEQSLHIQVSYDGDLTYDACAQATYALARLGRPALSSLIELTKGPTPWGRSRAIEALQLLNIRNPINEPNVILAIIQRLHDSDEYVRIDAHRALTAISGSTKLNNIYVNAIYTGIDRKDFDDSSALTSAYEDFLENDIVQVFSFGSEYQRLTYMDTIQGLAHPYSLFEGLSKNNLFAMSILHLKGIVLDSLLEDRPISNASSDAAVSSNIRETRMDPQLDAASANDSRRMQKLTVRDVQAVLDQNSELLEFVRFDHRLEKTNCEIRYGVMLINKTDEPVWVDLGGAPNVERNLNEYEQAMRGERLSDESILKTLYGGLVAPVLSKLPRNITTLIISPDSELNFLSFATLVNGQDQFLAERYQIKYVSSGRDLVYGRTATNVNPELAVFADPEFNGVPGLVATNATDLTMLSSDMRDYNGISLPRLPNTAQEAAYLTANSLAWHLKPAAYTGTAATEAQVKALHSPYILHLATHGFFLPDTEMTNRPGNFGLKQKMPVILHNPMQRSGLALVGAQLTLDSWQKGEVPDTENDGILMADEVAMLDLQNTWLVTLSACDTGIGEARAGEGVLGLRRGFIQAGAQNLLMTLWPVSDKWTVDLMKAFYERAMKTGDAPGALADVQRDFLVKLKKEKNLVMAARLAGPFVMNFQGKPGSN